MHALVMAGGEGRRLLPLTENLPKPMLRVGGVPMLDHVLLHLKRHGVTRVTLAVAYFASIIETYCGSSIHGLKISYLREETPLGTAGAISLLEDIDAPFFMMNGDVLTDIDLRSMLEQHKEHKAALTVGTKCMHTDLSLGILETDAAGRVTQYREKPRIEHRYGLGIYLVDPLVRNYMARNQRIDMPDLINRLIQEDRVVASYDHKGAWTDIGTPSEYSKVEKDFSMLSASVGLAVSTMDVLHEQTWKFDIPIKGHGK